MKQYLELLKKVIDKGDLVVGRDGITTKRIFGEKIEFDCRNGNLPLLTTKKVNHRSIIAELLWFVRGCTDNKVLTDQKVGIWTHNAIQFFEKENLYDNPHDLGPIYGFQWRHFGAKYRGCGADHSGEGVDQLKDVIRDIHECPASRRLIVSAWNPPDFGKMALPPCHVMHQYNVDFENRQLNMCVYQRSVDICIGFPFNMVSYAILLNIVCKLTGYYPGKLVFFLGDVHIYQPHEKTALEQLKREPMRASPLLEINPDKTFRCLEDFEMNDFLVTNYVHHGFLRYTFYV